MAETSWKSGCTKSRILLRSAAVRGLRSRLCGRILALSVAGAIALSAAGGGGADPSPAASGLQRNAASLAARSHRALLDLYSVETQLARAQARLAVLQSALTRARTQRLLMRHELALTGHAHAVSQRRLAQRLKALYEQTQPDPVAIILGARSVNEAISNIDELDRTARQELAIVNETASTRRALTRLSATLAAHTRMLQALEQQAAASVADRARAHAERAALVSALQTKEQFNRRQLTALETTARAAGAKSQTLTPSSAPDATTTTTDAAGTTAAAPRAPSAPPATDGSTTLTVSSTGYSLPGHTSTGIPVGWGVAAVDPGLIPLGTHMTVPGYGEAVAADTGSAVRGATIDLWFPTLAQARAWGRRTVTIALH